MAETQDKPKEKKVVKLRVVKSAKRRDEFKRVADSLKDAADRGRDEKVVGWALVTWTEDESATASWDVDSYLSKLHPAVMPSFVNETIRGELAADIAKEQVGTNSDKTD